MSARLDGEPENGEGGSEGNRVATGDTEAPPELTKTADEVTKAPGENDTGKENASQSDQIFTEKPTRGGAPQWSLYTITLILSSTTLKPSRFPARSLPFPTAASIPTVAPPYACDTRRCGAFCSPAEAHLCCARISQPDHRALAVALP